MKYIIADPEDQSRCQLKNSLDSYELLAFQGSFTTYEDATNSIHGKPPDIAFIRMEKAALDPFRLACELREQNPLIKVIFMSSYAEDAVEAFEYGSDGFVLIPFDEKKIKHMLKSFMARTSFRKKIIL